MGNIVFSCRESSNITAYSDKNRLAEMNLSQKTIQDIDSKDCRDPQ